MIGISVIFTACLVANPMTCKEVTLPIPMNEEEVAMVTPWKCERYGQISIKKWIETHPKWKPTRWKCVPKKEQKFDI